MRASKIFENSKSENPNSQMSEIHISGAEGLYSASDIQKVVRQYLERATNHPKGRADKIVTTVEEVRQMPVMISALPVATVKCQSQAEAKDIVMTLLKSSGISGTSVRTALTVIKRGSMRGAALITSEKARRLDPDRQRGIRVSRLGIRKQAGRLLSLKLSRHGINTDTVKEALILASKVMSHGDVMAELCISDDPDYTTGYISSGIYGYIRIPNIKKEGEKTGGRIFFLKEDTDVATLTSYLEKIPVIINRLSSIRGEFRIDEIAYCTDK